MQHRWQGLDRAAGRGLLVAGVALALALAAAAWWLLQPEYRVLFADLRPQDAATIAQELDKGKLPYRIGDDGASILVEQSQVHATRIKLMGGELGLHGSVGFELFNTSDFGMTEFAQKINYQRALQGELTRTILALEQVRDARVHLALPEQGLFRQSQGRPKAAITLTLREGQALRSEQVQGIQRLVAAATPGMTAQDVTVVDRRGVALSRTPEDSGDPAGQGGGGAARLELKRDTEALLVRKASAVLEKTFGTGRALASVDVTLDMDQVRSTVEDVLPTSVRGTESRGVLVKERESVRDGGVATLEVSARMPAGAGASTQRDAEYQVGRRVEQVVGVAGAVRRIQLVAVVPVLLDAVQQEQLRRLLAAAVGASLERGDTVVVQALPALLPAATEQTASAPPASGPTSALPPRPQNWQQPPHSQWLVPALLGAAGVVGLFGAVWVARREWRRIDKRPLADAPAAAREKVLDQVSQWMQAGEGADDAGARQTPQDKPQ